MSNGSLPSGDQLLCEAAYSIAQSVPLKVVLVFKCILCVAGAAAMLFLVHRKGVRWLVHPNAKFIFGAHVVFTIGLSVSFFAVYITDLVRLSLNHTDRCEYRLVLWIPLCIRTFAVAFLFGQIFTMTLLSFERLWASIRPALYEKRSTATFAAIAVFATAVISFGWSFGMIFPGNHLNSMVAAMVIRTEANGSRFQILGWSEMMSECITLVIFHIVLIMNAPKRNRRIAANLANRYQVRENFRLSVLFLPIMWLHAIIFTVISFGIYSFPFFYPGGGDVQLAFFTELVAWIPLYSLLLPVVVFWRLRRTKVEIMELHQSHRANYFQGVDQLFSVPVVANTSVTSGV